MRIFWAHFTLLRLAIGWQFRGIYRHEKGLNPRRELGARRAAFEAHRAAIWANYLVFVCLSFGASSLSAKETSWQLLGDGAWQDAASWDNSAMIAPPKWGAVPEPSGVTLAIFALAGVYTLLLRYPRFALNRISQVMSSLRMRISRNSKRKESVGIRHALAASAFAAIALVHAPGILAQSTSVSSLTLNPGSNSWFDSEGWSDGIPNGPGEIAELLLPTIRISRIKVAEPVTLGQLGIIGYGSATVQGTTPITFADDGADDLVLRLDPAGRPLHALISSPIELNDNKPLLVDVFEDGALQFDNTFASASGDLLKIGEGSLAISADNSTWIGSVDVAGGALLVDHPQALGTSSTGTTVRSGGLLEFQSPSAEHLVVEGGIVQLTNVALTGSISLVGSSTIYRPQNPVTVINGRPYEDRLGVSNIGGVITGAGDLIVRNDSNDPLFVRGASTYTGHTYISAGAVRITSARGLGDVSTGTTINGGHLSVLTPTDEPFRIEAGSLRFETDGSSPAGPLVVAGGDVYFSMVDTIDTPIVVEGPGGAIRGTEFSHSFIGGTTGNGNLRVVNLDVDAPLTHTGDLILEGARLNVANEHNGDTIIAGATEVNHEGAFGGSENVRVNGGDLNLHVLPSSEHSYFIERGNLIFPDSQEPITDSITIGGRSDASLRGDTVYEGPITILPGLRNRIHDGTFNGSIRGAGGLEIDSFGTVRLNAANALEGMLQIRAGEVHANHPDALGENSTIVSDGSLHVHFPAQSQIMTSEYRHGSGGSQTGNLVFEVPQEFSNSWVLHAGKITANAPVGMRRVISIGGRNDARITGGTVRIDEELTSLFRTTLDASITGDGDIRNVGQRLHIEGDLSEFHGNLIVENGLVYMEDRASSSFLHGAIHIHDGSTLRLHTSNDSEHVVDADIFLHNTQGGGDASRAALVHSSRASEARFRGRFDVGDEGSVTRGNFSVEGQVTGKNWTHRGGELALHSPQSQLSGILRLEGSSLNIAGEGSLENLDSILLENAGELRIASSTSESVDRVDDGIDVRSRGGRIVLYRHLDDQVQSETLGTLHLERASTGLRASEEAPLTIDNLKRDRGTILYFSQHGGDKGIRLPNATLQHHGMLGSWAVTEDGFATLDENGAFETLSATRTSLAAATEVDHVDVLADQLLDQDKTIASLRSERFDTTTDLGGHQLTIVSGGVFGGSIINGKLTVGPGEGDHELIFHGRGSLAANVIDNSDGGSVALVVNDGVVHLQGNNSYSGGTWVTGKTDQNSDNHGGTLIVESLSAIPPNDRVYIDNGIYDLQLDAESVKLGEIHLREGGSVRSGPPIDVDHIYLEEGIFSARLTGDGDIIKQTDGRVHFSSHREHDFAGVITVKEGILDFADVSFPQARIYVEGGTVQFSERTPNDIVLDGGSLIGERFTGTIDVRSKSVLPSTWIDGNLRGSGDIIIRGESSLSNRFEEATRISGNGRQFTGNIDIESGALRITAARAAGSGNIDVRAAGQLVLGNDSGRDGTLFVHNDVHLHGGTLYGYTSPQNFSSPAGRPSVLLGDVFVHEEGFIGAYRNGLIGREVTPGLTLAGQVTLADGAEVFGLSDIRHAVPESRVPLVDVSGELLVGNDTTWNLLTSTLSISGAIRANSPVSTIDFVGPRDQIKLGQAEIRADAGQRLALTFNGDSAPITLDGTGGALVGSGVLEGDFTIASDSRIAPGPLTNILTIDGDLTFEAGGRLEVDLLGTTLGESYDLLQVNGTAVLGGRMEISLNDESGRAFIPGRGDEFEVIAARDGISGEFEEVVLPTELGDQQIAWTVEYQANGLMLGVVDVHLTGDYDGNGFVDQGDLDLVLLHWGADEAQIPERWINSLPDGFVDQSELDAVLLNWGNTHGSLRNVAVPEPKTLALLAIAGLMLLAPRKLALA